MDAPQIKNLAEKKLIGKHLTMSLADNKTFQLWSGFMPRRKEIAKTLTSDFISMQVYDASYNFTNFDFTATFEKWAVVEVADFNSIPEGMESFVLPSGMYAVFIHVGPASEAERTFRYIFETWLPGSGYLLDDRPHFELIGTKYKQNDPESEEEVWIPIRLEI